MPLSLRLESHPRALPALGSLVSCPHNLTFPHWPPLTEYEYVPGASCAFAEAPWH